MKHFGVIGHPVAHSLSPLMHTTAYSLLGLECTYDAYDVSPDSLPQALKHFEDRGFSGLNVTIPNKERVLSLVQDLSDEARAVGAVNTILFENGRRRGENTDVYGISKSLEPCREMFEGGKVLLLGAGGSSRAIVYTLLTRFRPAEIVIVNRNPSRAEELVAHFLPYAKSTGLTSTPVVEATLPQLVAEARLVINGTSVGMSPLADASPVGDHIRFQPGQFVFDLIYTPLETRFLSQAERCGARTISGLEMFLYQGARSFELWLEQPMPVDQIRPLLLTELRNRQLNKP